jgi:ElaB/YqjD/DUF883 family membrane-anchored ribosome-binding protein
MANEPKTTSAKAEDIQKALEQQISELRDEIARINDAVAERSADMMDSAREKASEVYEGAADRAARASRQLRSQADVVSEVARENPGTTTAVLGAVALIGFMLGMVVGQSTAESHHRRWHM